jgi:NAD(P)-dependent dehydrogenase (short-subunit alcohol dehydrogenase family)
MTIAQKFTVDDQEFAGKRVLVTGGTKGAGEAIVVRLSAAGAAVLTTARSALPDALSPMLFVQADVSTLAGTEAVAAEVMEQLGGEEPRWRLCRTDRSALAG